MDKINILPLLEQLEREKNISKEEMMSVIEKAIVSAFQKQKGKKSLIEANIDRKTGEINIYQLKKVVENVKDVENDISYEDAKKLNKEVKLGDRIKLPLDPTLFSRIAAQTAKQIIIQKVRETEKKGLYKEFKPKEGKIIGGYVYRYSYNGDIIVTLGKVEGILPFKEHVKRERFRIGEYMRALILRVEETDKGPRIILSRSRNDFIMKIFESECPEIKEGVVEIMKIGRLPGIRTKVAVRSKDPKIDPIGSCVGLRGSRIKPIMEELRGEKMDLILYSDDPKQYVAEALSPAKVLSIEIIDEKKKIAEVIVDKNMLAVAIGKNGQNVALASELTGWNIEIKTEEQKQREKFVEEMTTKYGMPKSISEILSESGYTSVDDLKNVDETVLKHFKIPPEIIRKIKSDEKESYKNTR